MNVTCKVAGKGGQSAGTNICAPVASGVQEVTFAQVILHRRPRRHHDLPFPPPARRRSHLHAHYTFIDATLTHMPHLSYTRTHTTPVHPPYLDSYHIRILTHATPTRTPHPHERHTYTHATLTCHTHPPTPTRTEDLSAT